MGGWQIMKAKAVRLVVRQGRPPIRAAFARFIPSSTAANDKALLMTRFIKRAPGQLASFL